MVRMLLTSPRNVLAVAVGALIGLSDRQKGFPFPRGRETGLSKSGCPCGLEVLFSEMRPNLIAGPANATVAELLSLQSLPIFTRVLRYPDFQRLYGLSGLELLEYSRFLHSVSDLVILGPHYRAPLRDPSDLVVLQTADRAGRMWLCTSDGDFRDPAVVASCGARGIEICDEFSPLTRLA
jgi:hypothetical protein